MAQCGQVQAMVLRTLGIEMCRVYLCVRCFSTLKLLSMYLYNLSIYNSRFCFDMSYTFATYYVSNILYTLWSICINTLYMHYSDVDSEHETMDRKHSLQSITKKLLSRPEVWNLMKFVLYIDIFFNNEEDWEHTQYMQIAHVPHSYWRWIQ